MIRPLVLALLALALVSSRSQALPLKGDENILFIGNSLTASLASTLNFMAEDNQLPAFNGHQVQLWAETLKTHVLLSPEQTPKKFNQGENRGAGMKGYAVSAAFCSLWKKGQYDIPLFNDRGYITALDAIARGTPEGKPWDYVIIQGYSDAHEPGNRVSRESDGRIVAEGDFLVYGGRLIEAAKAAGARPILYMPWLLNPEQGGGADNPESYYNQRFDALIANYKALGAAHDVPVVPVGEAMRALSKDRKPEGVRTAWLIRDNVHGTVCGSALLHYTMASALWGKPASDLVFRTRPRDGSKVAQGEATDGYAIGNTEPKHGTLITEQVDAAIKSVAADVLSDHGWKTSPNRPSPAE